MINILIVYCVRFRIEKIKLIEYLPYAKNE